MAFESVYSQRMDKGRDPFLGGGLFERGLVQRGDRHALCIRGPYDLVCLRRTHDSKAEVIQDALENPEHLFFRETSRREHGHPALDDGLIVDEVLPHDVAHKPDQVAQLYIIKLHLNEAARRGRRSLRRPARRLRGREEGPEGQPAGFGTAQEAFAADPEAPLAGLQAPWAGFHDADPVSGPEGLQAQWTGPAPLPRPAIR